jgi:hypothetical protein
MILDKDMLFADSLAHNGTPTVLDLGNADVGPGNPIRCFFTTETTLTGCTGLIITDGATSAAADDLMTLDDPLSAVGTIEFTLPSKTQRYVKIDLEGSTSAGTYSCGVVLPGVQTSK